MNIKKLILRSLTYYRKAHLWIILGAMLSTAVLVGAFVIGDSVRYSLRRIVFDRLGETEWALTASDRFFRTDLADRLSEALDVHTAPLLQTRGIAVAGGGDRRVNRIQVYGVDARFGQLGGAPGVYDSLSTNEAVVNRPLAARLGVDAGDEILIRAENLEIMPLDAPLSLDSEVSLARRFTVKSVAEDSSFGRFDLRADQVAPLSVFVALPVLSREMDMEGRANVLLVANREDGSLDLSTVQEAFDGVWSLEDAGLELGRVENQDSVELRTSRIFLESSVVDAALSAYPSADTLLTYFVNEIRKGEKTTPYSFVSALGVPPILSDLNSGEMVINEWLADDLSARVGDLVEMTYFVLGAGRSLEEKSADFRIKAVVPLQGPFADRTLLPNYPGLADEESCRDWNPGIPIDLEKIRDKDEDYWDRYRGTPKAFVSLASAQSMWGNRFGSATAMRFPGEDLESVREHLNEKIDPSALGFRFNSVKASGLRASEHSVSFSELFLGLSFFIVLAALLLTGLLFVFNTEARSGENGLYLALGFSKREVRKLVLLEGAVLIAVGSFFGAFLGLLYNQGILIALKTVWRAAVGTSALRLHLDPVSILAGVFTGAAVAFLAIWLVTKKQVRKSIVGLQRGQAKVRNLAGKRPKISLWTGLLCLGAVCAVLVGVRPDTGEMAFAGFFAAGFLFLSGMILLSNVFLYKIGSPSKRPRMSLLSLGFRNNARKRLRSLTVIGLLSCGLFIVFTVGANRLSSLKDADKRSSGTGGFALYGESSLPLLYDLNTPKGREFYGLDRLGSEDIRYVQFRVRGGDDASCLNLNQVTNPPLIGVDPQPLAARGSFTFSETTEDVDPGIPWSVLNKRLPGGLVPAVADRSVIVWGMGLSIGDVLTYVDEEGEPFRLKIVGGLSNSIFQGKIIISEDVMLQKYPSLSGYRMVLVDLPQELGKMETASQLSWIFQDVGLDIVPASQRLAEFNAVQNTYLSIFLILGSFGLILGSFGLGIVVWRHIKEREGELALMRAVGFSKRSISFTILAEHLALLAGGIVFGISAALLASLPALLTPGGQIPYPTILIIFVLVSVNGTLWTSLAAKMATRQDLLPTLRKE